MSMKELIIEISVNGNKVARTFKLPAYEDIEQADWNPIIISMVETIKESANYTFNGHD